jgi:glycosyltransferase involved in cell wall biosynthesis
MKRVLLIDFAYVGSHGGGHNESYLLRMATILTTGGYYVYLCSGNNSKLRKNHVISELHGVEIVDLDLRLIDKAIRRLFIAFDGFLSALKLAHHYQLSSLINVMSVRRLQQSLGADIPVFFAHAESMLPAVPVKVSRWFMPKQWAGLCVLPSYQSDLQFDFKRSRLLFNREKNLGLSSCRSILVLHPTYQRFFLKRFRHLNCLCLPEMVDIETFNNEWETSDSETVNLDLLSTIKNKAQGKKIIAFLGSITPRKNLPLFLSAMANLQSDEVFTLVLGKLKPPPRSSYPEEYIQSINFYQSELASHAYIDTDYFIQSEKEFYSLISISDIVYLVYENHPFSSSILTKAMVCKKPVLVNKGYLMEETVQAYRWKTAVNAKVEDIVKAVEDIVASGYQVDDASHLAFLRDHDPDRFDAAILDACAQFEYGS